MFRVIQHGWAGDHHEMQLLWNFMNHVKMKLNQVFYFLKFSWCVYRQAFQDLHMGYASAMAWVLFVVILSLTAVQFGLSKRWVYYEGDQKS